MVALLAAEDEEAKNQNRRVEGAEGEGGMCYSATRVKAQIFG